MKSGKKNKTKLFFFSPKGKYLGLAHFFLKSEAIPDTEKTWRCLEAWRVVQFYQCLPSQAAYWERGRRTSLFATTNNWSMPSL